MSNQKDHVIDLDHRITSTLTPEGFREMIKAMAERAMSLSYMVPENVFNDDTKSFIPGAMEAIINEIQDMQTLTDAFCDSIQSEEQSEEDRL